eukprot:scaffold2045_cov404-Prasinococcus_capsulatus_cf.AAC.52
MAATNALHWSRSDPPGVGNLFRLNQLVVSCKGERRWDKPEVQELERDPQFPVCLHSLGLHNVVQHQILVNT